MQNDIYFYENIGTVIIARDFNGRISSKLDYVVHDNNVHGRDRFDYNPDEPLPRASADSTSYSQGTQLFDLCKSTSMKIGNGRLDGGQNFTYYNRMGASVIDYILLRYESSSSVSNLQILDFNEFSTMVQMAHFSFQYYFTIPNSEFRILNSEFRIPKFVE